MVKLKSKQASVKNCKLVVPVDGTITIDGNGIVEVSDECAKQLLTIERDWAVADKNAKVDNTTEDNGEDAEESFEDKLKKLTVAELKSMCEEANLPEEEWGKMKKAELIDYVIAKTSDEEEEDEVEDDEEEENNEDEK